MSVHRSVWEVEDKYFFEPQEKIRSVAQLIDLVSSGWDVGFWSGCILPPSCFLFIKNILIKLRIPLSRSTTIESVCKDFLMHLDYRDPYYVLVSAPLELQQYDYAKYTYKLKKTKSTLNPEEIEVFQVDPKYSYPNYKEFLKIMEDPRTMYIASGNTFTHPTTGRVVDLSYLFETFSKIVWGSASYLDACITENREMYYDDISYQPQKHADTQTLAELTHSKMEDENFWRFVVVSFLAWLKGPDGFKWLVSSHPLYQEVFFEDDQTGRIYTDAATGGMVIINNIQIFTKKDVEVIASGPPGVCECCNTNVHCTKLVNFNAIKHPMCSCGRSVNPTDLELDDHPSWEQDCRNYYAMYPPHVGYICINCLYKNSQHGYGATSKCPRAVCPNTRCQHHMGEAARIMALTRARTNQLPSSRTH